MRTAEYPARIHASEKEVSPCSLPLSAKSQPDKEKYLVSKQPVLHATLKYSNIGIFTLEESYSLAPHWEVLSIFRGPISREDLIRIFSSKRKKSAFSKAPVIAQVEILDITPSGVQRLRLLEFAHIESES